MPEFSRFLSATDCKALLRRRQGNFRQGQEAFTVVEIMIVIGVIALLVSIALPNFIRARQAANVRVCISNLRKIEDGKGQWALEYAKKDDDIPTQTEIVPYLKNNKWPRCPASGTYRLRRVSRIPTCTLTAIGHSINNLNMDDDPFAD